MLRLINGPCDHIRGMHLEETRPEEREYEALATVRDVLLLLYSEISENTGADCERLRQAFEYLDALTLITAQGL